MARRRRWWALRRPLRRRVRVRVRVRPDPDRHRRRRRRCRTLQRVLLVLVLVLVLVLLLLLLLLRRRRRRRGHCRRDADAVRGSSRSCASAPICRQYLHLPHLLLPDLVVAVRDEVLPDLRERVGHPGVRLSRRRKRRDLDVQLLVQVLVLGVVGGAEVLLLEQDKKKELG